MALGKHFSWKKESLKYTDMARGRPLGSLNKRTIEAREKHAIELGKQLKRVKAENRKLPKEHLGDLAHLFIGMAEVFQPDNPRVVSVDPGKANPHADEAKFEKYMRLGLDCLKAWAPYVHPTFKAVAIAQPATTTLNGESTIADPDEPVRYPTVAEIRRRLAERGLPPLKDILAIEKP